MNGHLKGFREFLLKQNAVALAIGVIIGAALGRVVSGLVDDVLMPILGVVMPGGEWRNAQITLSGANAIKYGDLIGRLLDFVIVAAVVYTLAQALIRGALAAATRTCPECLSEIPVGARKCRACGSAVTG
jgi:large conductance mechanosensitive channel